MKERNWQATLLGALEQLRQARGATSLPNGEGDLLLAEACRALASPRCEIGVVGLQGHGKSTLINALLGQEIVRAAASIATARIVRLRHGPPGVEVRGPGAAVQRYPLDALSQISDHDGQLDAPESAEIVAFCQSPFLEDGVCLVDTPGLSAGLGAESDDAQVEQYLREAAVLLIANHCIKPGLGKSLELAVRAASNADLVVALTCADRLDEDQVEEAIDATRRQLDAHCLAHIEIVPVSAYRALVSAPEDTDHVGAIERLRAKLRESALRGEMDLIARLPETLARAGEAWREQWQPILQECDAEAAMLEVRRQEETVAAERRRAWLGDVKRAIAESVRNWRPSAVGIAPEAEKVALASLESSINSWTIPEVNRRLGSHVHQKLATLAADRAEQLVTDLRHRIQEWSDLLEPHDIRIDLALPESLPFGVPQITIPPQPEGFGAWLDDPGDAKRKSAALLSAISEFQARLETIALDLEREARSSLAELRDHVQRSIDEAHARVAIPSWIEEQSASVASRRRRLKKEWQHLQRHLNHLRDLASDAALRVELEEVECLKVFRCAEVRLECLAGLSGDLKDLCRRIGALHDRLPGASPRRLCYWAHIEAGTYFAGQAEIGVALRQADLAAELRESVSQEEVHCGTRQLLAALRSRATSEQILGYLARHADGNDLANERIAVGLLSGDGGYVRRVMDLSGLRDAPATLHVLARYACREPSCQGKGEDHPLHKVLWECHERIDMEADVDRMTCLVRADPSIQRHIIGRLRQFIVLDPEEADLIERAYHALKPDETLIPRSFQAYLESVVAGHA